MDMTLSYFFGYFAFGFAVGCGLTLLVAWLCTILEDREYDGPIDL